MDDLRRFGVTSDEALEGAWEVGAALRGAIVRGPALLGLAPDGLPWDAPTDEHGQRYSRWSDVRNLLPGEEGDERG
ncbi:hypothetical protein [Actinoplanes siamensis]|uniref:Uncharacterized protein n=1 Tax=Actinoplanes siamensis TaxID=1223317 RepID=A0A919TMT0_9ACTN|nr:hypothetical protein [Actinoplanes siamensis]GIF08676.1 hypothetical protein Asi03nite_62140 [Actinoplanes siamensis]